MGQAAAAESGGDVLPLFEWLPLLALATGRKMIKAPQASVAMFIALSADGTSGEGATVDAGRLAVELGVSERQVWRHVRDLVDGGWIALSSPAIRGQKGKPGSGRRARYRLTSPRLDLSGQTGPHGLTLRSVDDV